MTSPDHPWNPLPREPVGDAKASTIYEAVGHALTDWEWVEGNLAMTFALLCDASFAGAVNAYGMVTAFSARHDMLHAAFEAFGYAHEPEFKPLPKLFERIRKLSARRNEIAHGRVVRAPSTTDGPSGYYLCPASYNTNKRYRPLDLLEKSEDPMIFWQMALGKYAYTAAQIDFYRRQFGLAGMEVREFQFALQKRIGHD